MIVRRAVTRPRFGVVVMSAPFVGPAGFGRRLRTRVAAPLGGVVVERIGGVLDRERRREREVERLTAAEGREVGAVLGLAGRDRGEPALERVGLEARDRAEVGAE